MKRSIRSLIASSLLSGALTLGIVSSSLTASAQNSPFAEAKIPFAFQVGKTLLPAGDYLLSRQSPSMIMVRDRKATATAIFVAYADTKTGPVEKGAIVFTRYGDRYFVRNISVPSSSDAYKCVRSKQETAVSRSWESQKAETVAVNVEPTLHR